HLDVAVRRGPRNLRRHDGISQWQEDGRAERIEALEMRTPGHPRQNQRDHGDSDDVDYEDTAPVTGHRLLDAAQDRQNSGKYARHAHERAAMEEHRAQVIGFQSWLKPQLRAPLLQFRRIRGVWKDIEVQARYRYHREMISRMRGWPV